MGQPLLFLVAHEPESVVVECQRRTAGEQLEVTDFIGKRVLDVVESSSGDVTLGSPLLFQVLRDAKATGWHGEPIKLADEVGARLPDLLPYRTFRVDGAAGPLRMTRSGAELSLDTLWSDEVVDIDWSSWDGSDVFQAGKHGVFVVPLVAAALVAANLANMELRTIDDMISAWRNIFPQRSVRRPKLP